MSWDGTERRQHKRYGVRRLGIQYAKPGLFGTIAGYSERYLVLNVSEGGLFFMTKEDLREGSALRVRMQTPKHGETIKAKGTVVWSQKSQEHNASRVGVRLDGLGARSLDRLRELLEETVLDRIDVTTGIYLREVERL